MEALRDEIATCKRPLIFFHDDPDGLASFLLIERAIGEGRGVVVKAHPQLTTMFLNKVVECAPDKVFVLDIALVDQEFIDNCPVPVVWVDHHDPVIRDKVKYFNPLKSGNKASPVAELCYQAVQKDMWIAAIGAIGDWHMPHFEKEMREKHPELLPDKVKTVEEALFDSPLTPLVKLFSFVLKGPTGDVNRNIRVLTKIAGPKEIFEQDTPRGKLLWRAFERINEVYDTMLQRAFTKVNPNEPIVVYTYVDDQLSLTKDLANELLHRSGKVVVLGRERMGEVRCSLRAPSNINLKKALESALDGVNGYGGGHEQACGAAIKIEDWKRFLMQLRAALGI